MAETEIWKALPGSPGIEVSTFGRFWTLDRVASSENGTCFLKGRVLKQSYNDKGYLKVHIPINEKRATKRAHRLVAEAFIPNPNNLPQVNHKDGNRSNNNVDNLEWCTRSYNNQYREKFGKALNRPVFAINLKTLEISRFGSQSEAGRNLGINVGNINRVIKGNRSHAGGYWFVSDDGHAVDVVKSKLHDVGGVGLKIKQGR